MSNYFNYLDSTGFDLAVDLPDDCVQECSASGSVDEAVDFWVDELKFDPNPDRCRNYLKSTGGWADDELTDDESNRRRLLWVVCCELNERN